MYESQEYEGAAELLGASEQSAEVLWRRCRVLVSQADTAKEAGQLKQAEALLREGLGYVSAALDAAPTNFATHKWYAVAVSKVSTYDGTKATIEKSFVVKEHFTQAAELNPHDATSRHLLGLWYWEVAGLSWTMRKVAAAIFASPPTGSYEDALSQFMQAEAIEAGFYLRNRLMIAKCHRELRDKGAARKWLNSALDVPIKNSDDRTAAEEATTLLNAL